MRIWTGLAVVCVALASAACDTDEPLTADNGGGDLQIELLGQATAPLWNVWDWGEDANGNGVLDHEPDLPQGNCDPRAPNCPGTSLPNGDGRFDSGEDLNHNGILDPGEDRNGNGLLNTHEDLNDSGLLDFGEDVNANCVLDPGEDLNSDGQSDSEDIDCDGWLDQQNEDRNRNGIREFEDTNGNSQLDSGIWCEDTFQTISGPVPVPIAGQVVLYRLGNPTPEVLANLGSSGGSAFSGLTPYDNRVFAELPDKTVSFGGGSLQVRRGQQLSSGSSRIMNAEEARSPENTPTCTVGFALGAPNLGIPLPLTAQGSTGDNVSVRVRIASVFSTIERATDYALTGRVLRNGVPLPTSGVTSAPPGGTITFSVTVP